MFFKVCCLCMCLSQLSSSYRVNEAKRSAVDGEQERRSCDKDAYYSGVDLTSPDAVRALVKSNINRLSYKKVYSALEDLDENHLDNTKVDMLYSKLPQTKASRRSTAWNREHLWPKSYGVSCKKSNGKYTETNGPFTDLHHLFAADTLVNADRSSEYFDQCTEGTCDYPANPDDGYTTQEKESGESKDGKTFWMPPKKSRGVVARALFFMALRYDGVEKDTYDLVLSDCPRHCKFALGKLSVLKQWHAMYPVTEAELARNAGVCEKQGNRNPFIDDPSLVDRFFGSTVYPDLVVTDCGACENSSPMAPKCDGVGHPSPSPAAVSPSPSPAAVSPSPSAVVVSSGSCGNYGCIGYKKSNSCQCNSNCAKYHNCCSDFHLCPVGAAASPRPTPTPAPAGSCANYGCSSMTKGNLCQCNSKCTTYGDCCSDYAMECPQAMRKSGTSQNRISLVTSLCFLVLASF